MLEIFKRDFARLICTPAAFITLFGILFLPAVYGWFSTYAYSDPYSRTGNLSVAVANMDSPSIVEGEKIDVGSQLVTNLKKDRELDWKFVGEKEAENGVRSGKYFAAFVIPAGFSQSLATAIENPSTARKPYILYLSNQEKNPVTPKITSIGAVKIQREINAQIDSTLLKAIMEKASVKASTSKSSVLAATESAMKETEELRKDLSQIRSDQKKLASNISLASFALSSASKSLSSFNSFSPLSISFSSSFPTLPTKGLEEKISELASQIARISSLPLPSSLKNQISSSLSSLSSSLSSLSSRLSLLQKYALQAKANAQSLILNLETKEEEAKIAASKMPSFLSSSSKDLESLSSALKEADGPLGQYESELYSLSSSLSQIQSSAFISFLSKIGDLDASGASSFLSSPVKLETVAVYPASYIQAIAPFFLTLSLWVGSFMLVIIYDLFPDRKRIGKIGARRGYFARLFLFWFISILQSLVSSVGEAWILGFKVRFLPLFFFSALFSSIIFSSIIYAMAVCMGKLGKALALVAIMIQIPSSGGMDPIPLLPAPYRVLYPFLPFTYALNLFRTSLTGGRAWLFVKNAIFLSLFALFFSGVALILFPALSSLQKSLNLRLKAADFFVSEGENLPSSSRLEKTIFLRLSLQPKEKVEMERERFKSLYQKTAMGVCIFFFSLPLVPMILMFSGIASRSLFLFMWVGSYAAGMSVAALMEYVKLCAQNAVEKFMKGCAL